MFKFPTTKLTESQWFEELQNPLDFKVEDIRNDFAKFVKDFPIDIIPHQTDLEYNLGTRHIKSNIKQITDGKPG